MSETEIIESAKSLRKDGEVAMVWIPTEADQIGKMPDIAQAYAVVLTEQASSGLIVFAMWRGMWEANPWSSRPVIRELMKRLGLIQQSKAEATNV